MTTSGATFFGVDHVIALTGELMVERLDDGAQEDVGGPLGLGLFGVEVQAAKMEEP